MTNIEQSDSGPARCEERIPGTDPKREGYDPNRCILDKGHKGSHFADFYHWRKGCRV